MTESVENPASEADVVPAGQAIGIGPRTPGRWWLPATIFCLALVVRLVYLAEDSSSPFFEYRGIDAKNYHEMALALDKGDWPGEEPFSWPPLYPLFLGVLYKTIGHGVTLLKVVHLVLGSISCVLVFLIARRVFAERFVAVASALACCLCGTMIFFDGQLLSASLDVMLQLLTLFVLLVAGRRAGSGWWALAGLCIGLCAINRGGILLFLPVVLVWLYAMARWRWDPPGGWATRAVRPSFWRAGIALLAPVGLLILPVSWHNARYDAAGPGQTTALPPPAERGAKSNMETLRGILSGEFAPLAANVGINFRLGNDWEHRHLNDPNHPRCFAYYDQVVEEPARQGVTSASGQSRYLVRTTIERIVDKPLDFVKLMGFKLLQLLSGDETPRNSNLYAFRQHAFLLSVLLWKKVIAFPSGLIIPLGLLGVILQCRDWRRHFPLFGLLAAQSAFMLAFFVTARYRLPTLPLLTMYGACAVEMVIRRLQRGAAAKVIAPTVLLAGLLVLCNMDIGKMRTAHGSFEHQNIGATLAEEGRLDEALPHLTKALRLSPGSAKAHYNLGNVLALQGKTDEAIRHFTKSLEIEPRNAGARNTLGKLMVKEGKPGEAAEQFTESLRINPYCAEAHHNLGRVLVQLGRLDEAVDCYNKALRLNPRRPEVYNDLAMALASRGDVAEAIAHYEEAVRLKPDLAGAYYNLGNALVKAGKFEEAVRRYRDAVRYQPELLEAHINLANTLVIQGRLGEAVEHYTEAVRLGPDSVDTRYRLAGVLARQGRLDEAAEEYRRLLQIDPSHALARRSLEAVLSQRRQSETP
ncbi:MAG: tetratricopeptide repeat protein [Phycisphaerae bacterium]|nr:tetratricopeptide repeat protein [Phycisphaerae bacterium]